jgi:hypothetical protein
VRAPSMRVVVDPGYERAVDAAPDILIENKAFPAAQHLLDRRPCAKNQAAYAALEIKTPPVGAALSASKCLIRNAYWRRGWDSNPRYVCTYA